MVKFYIMFMPVVAAKQVTGTVRTNAVTEVSNSGD